MALALVGGTAWAYWTGSGSGDGGGGLTAPVVVTLVPGSAPATLYPGGASNVVLTVSNPNVTSAHITTLALDTSQGSNGFAVDTNHLGCTLTSLGYTPQTNGTTGWTVPGKTGGTNGTLAITLPSALTMSISAPNACQGATFTVYLVAS